MLTRVGNMAEPGARLSVGNGDLLTCQKMVLEAHCQDLQRTLDRDRDAWQQKLGEKDEELLNMRSQMLSQLEDYESLLDVKLALDMEINAYRKMLEVEEQRWAGDLLRPMSSSAPLTRRPLSAQVALVSQPVSAKRRGADPRPRVQSPREEKEARGGPGRFSCRQTVQPLLTEGLCERGGGGRGREIRATQEPLGHGESR